MLYALGAFCCDRYLRKRQKLKDISADPKSAGELGGLLIRWVRDGFFLVRRDYSFQ